MHENVMKKCRVVQIQEMHNQSNKIQIQTIVQDCTIPISWNNINVPSPVSKAKNSPVDERRESIAIATSNTNGYQTDDGQPQTTQ